MRLRSRSNVGTAETFENPPISSLTLLLARLASPRPFAPFHIVHEILPVALVVASRPIVVVDVVAVGSMVHLGVALIGVRHERGGDVARGRVLVERVAGVVELAIVVADGDMVRARVAG